jgi:hypothetical protein
MASIPISVSNQSLSRARFIQRNEHKKSFVFNDPDLEKDIKEHVAKKESGFKHAALLIELERTRAQQFAGLLIQEGKLPESGEIIISYPPRSGIHIAHGIADGLKLYSNLKPIVYPYNPRSNEVPDQAICNAINNSGLLILCDDTSALGHTLPMSLGRFSEKIKPETRAIMFVSNLICPPEKMLKYNGARDVTLYQGASSMDSFDKADMIAATCKNPHTRRYMEDLRSLNEKKR